MVCCRERSDDLDCAVQRSDQDSTQWYEGATRESLASRDDLDSDTGVSGSDQDHITESQTMQRSRQTRTKGSSGGDRGLLSRDNLDYAVQRSDQPITSSHLGRHVNVMSAMDTAVASVFRRSLAGVCCIFQLLGHRSL
eukprot:CAMPEP_0201112146 /NCGR_PEP_ID=MMETSP0812-20130820/77063_1 /ASSEMBLY_ACC=CAM_ASM_000668 /TAXON_ID=98059 /ORGANISM="Dinobryon sp., Strain UTEXLB2267" /LENGTH=137 /DNA_ID=CAMNT_0047375407 /DNA_START=978 /DNA_END=1391 /DNA_ORIENTATION=-